MAIETPVTTATLSRAIANVDTDLNIIVQLLVGSIPQAQAVQIATELDNLLAKTKMIQQMLGVSNL